MQRTSKTVLLFFTLLSVVLSGCAASEREYSRVFFALNTMISLKAYGGAEAKQALKQAVDRVNEIEKRMSATVEDSDVSKINQRAGEEPVQVHDDTFYVIEKALEYGEKTDGAFDITIYPISQLWGITSDHPRVPRREEIEEKLKLVNFRWVLVDRENRTVFLEKKGMGIDLGAIAKGYAADEVTRIFREAGVKSALINMGGNVVAIGNRPDGNPWRIGIRDPRMEETEKEHIGILDATDQSIVSSGDYERYIKKVFEETGVRYHHIFDPKTGYPAQAGLIGTTIVAPRSIDADALSTSLFIMGAEKGFDLIKTVEGARGIAVTNDKRILLSHDFGQELTLTNEEYKVQS